MTNHTRRSLTVLTVGAFALGLTIPPVAFGTEATNQPSPQLVRDRGKASPQPIVVIDRKVAKQTTVLSAAEVATIKALQSVVYPTLVSLVSPTGETVVIQVMQPGATETYKLLNIQTGTQIDLDSKRFRGFQPGHFYWRDEETAASLASNDEGDEPVYALLLVDRRTGKVTIQPITLPGAPESVAPDASRVLVRLKRASATPPQPKEVDQQESESDDEDEDESLPTEYRVISLLDETEVYRFSLPAEISVYQAAWTPDAARLAIVRGWQAKRTDIDWAANAGASLASLTTRDAMGVLPPSENPYLQKSGLTTIDLTTGQQQTIYATERDSTLFLNADWSPDGQMLLVKVGYSDQPAGRTYPIFQPGLTGRSVFRFYDDRLQAIGQMEPPELTDPSTSGQFIAADQILFTALVGMNVWLYRYNLHSGSIQKVSPQAGSYGTYGVAATTDATHLVFSYSSYSLPPELYRMNWDGETVTPLTSFNGAVTKTNPIRQDPVTFQLPQGETFDGVLIQPANASFPPRNVPLVVWQEGGPYSSVINEWSAQVEAPFALLPNFGIGLLIVPLYGRYGFGAERFNALYDDRNFGQIDIDAMAEIVKQAIALGYTSPGKVGITGCSYGGYFTTQSIVRHPQLYAAASTQCSWVDLIADWLHNDPEGTPFVFGSLTPYNDAAEFRKDSPAYNVEQIRTPLLIFHGSHDFLPVTLIESFYWQLAQNKTPTRLVKFMGAGHGLVDDDEMIIPEYELYAAQELIQWFRMYLER